MYIFIIFILVLPGPMVRDKIIRKILSQHNKNFYFV